MKEFVKKPVQWKPAKLLDTIFGLNWAKYTYRWVSNDPANVSKKLAEGWETVSSLKGDKVEHVKPGLMDDGAEMTPSMTSYRELVLMRISNELADSRKEYYSNMTNEGVNALKTRFADQAGAIGGTVHGSIKIGGRVIE